MKYLTEIEKKVYLIVIYHDLRVQIANLCSAHSARRPRTSRRRPNLGQYVSFPDVLIRRGRRKDEEKTSRPNRTCE